MRPIFPAGDPGIYDPAYGKHPLAGKGMPEQIRRKNLPQILLGMSRFFGPAPHRDHMRRRELLNRKRSHTAKLKRRNFYGQKLDNLEHAGDAGSGARRYRAGGARLPAGVRQRGPQSGQQPWLVLFFDGR